MIAMSRTQTDGIEEPVELYEEDIALIDRTAELLSTTRDEVIRRLISVYFQPARKAICEKNIGIRWRSDDIPMQEIRITMPQRYTSYIERWRPEIGSWGTQMTNGALDWFKNQINAKPDEQTIRDKLAKYLTDNGIPYHIDIISEMDLGANRNAEKSLNEPGWPDVFIARASGDFHGLFIELKQEAPMINPEHIAKQLEIGQKLKAEGYEFEMAFGYNRAVQAIEKYLRKGNE